MYKSFPFYSSHSLSAELEVGVCYLELPLNRVDPAGIHESASRWRAGGDADLSVGCQVLNNGAPLHAVEAETSGAASYDEQRVAFFYGEALGLPVRVRDQLRAGRTSCGKYTGGALPLRALRRFAWMPSPGC